MDIVAIFSSSFACHYNAPKLYYELQDRSPGRWLTISCASFTVVVLFFALFAVAGYGRFGQAIDGNILNSYESKARRWEHFILQHHLRCVHV